MAMILASQSPRRRELLGQMGFSFTVRPAKGEELPHPELTPAQLVEELRHLNEQLGIPATLSEVGVTADKIPAMAKDAMKSGNIPANPRQSTVKDIIKLYEKTM